MNSVGVDLHKNKSITVCVKAKRRRTAILRVTGTAADASSTSMDTVVYYGGNRI